MFGVPLQTSDTSRGPYYAGTPPAGVPRQLPGRESVPLWSPFKPEGPAPAFRWQKTTCGVGEEARVAFQFHCSRLVCGGKAKRGSLSFRSTEPLMHQGKSESCVFLCFIIKDHSFSTFQSLQKTGKCTQ